MRNIRAFISYALAAISGMCFWRILKTLSEITGGLLLSLSVLFGGLALTVMTIKEDGDDE